MKKLCTLSVIVAVLLLPLIGGEAGADGNAGVQLIGRVSSTSGGIPQVLASRDCHPGQGSGLAVTGARNARTK